MSATITTAALEDLKKGCAHLSILDIADGNTVTSNIKGRDFSAADELFSIEGTFSCVQSEGEDLKVDQYGGKIIETNPGDWLLQGDFPSNASAVFDMFYTSSLTISSSDKITGKTGQDYVGKSYNRQPKTITKSVLVESESGQTAILFAYVSMYALYKDDDPTKPAKVSFTGKVGTNNIAGEGDFAVLKAAE